MRGLPEKKYTTCSPWLSLVISCAVIEIVAFASLYLLGQDGFRKFVWVEGTSSYFEIAYALVEKGTLISSPRTLGYPLFLFGGYVVGGPEGWLHLVIATQLTLNLLFTFICWRLLERLAADAGRVFRWVATLFFFFAGLGMALTLLTDFLAAFFFSLFAYGLIYWRRRSAVFLSALALAVAILLRPSFTLIPLLLPLAAYWIKQFSSQVPWSHLAIYVLFSLVATGASIAYQYASQRYPGPSPVLTINIAHFLHRALSDEPMTKQHYKIFYDQIAQDAGQPFIALSEKEKEQYAVQKFKHEMLRNPGRIIFYGTQTLLKSLFVPTESLIQKIFIVAKDEPLYLSYVRPLVALLCLPFFILALVPPLNSVHRTAYYLTAMLFLFYIVGISAINPLQGERIRFPALMLLMPLLVWNLEACTHYLRSIRNSFSAARYGANRH